MVSRTYDKTRRMIAANLSLVDAVVEILDARIPSSSQNPEMQRLVKEKPRMLLLNKADMADPNATARWVQYYQKQNLLALPLDCKTGKGIKQFVPMVRNQLLKPLMEKRARAGIVGAPIRLMIVGIPNVGKSSFINRMAQSKKAKVEDRPGVTRTKQWVKIGDQMELLDMPGFSGRSSTIRKLQSGLPLPVRLKMILWTWKVWQCSCWNFWRSDTRKHWKLVIKCRFPMRTAGYSCWNSSAENGDADFWRRSQL